MAERKGSSVRFDVPALSYLCSHYYEELAKYNVVHETKIYRRIVFLTDNSGDKWYNKVEIQKRISLRLFMAVRMI